LPPVEIRPVSIMTSPVFVTTFNASGTT
jgi:hypothetical protein